MTPFVFVLAALAEIGGSFAFWAVLRLGAPGWLIVPGTALLMAFAWALTLAPAAYAGRAFASYGGVYITASVMWLWAVEGRVPDRWDILGTAVSLAGAAIILFGPRGA
ncbi:MAG: YnfA family protein [Pseudomonadota bacterium]